MFSHYDDSKKEYEIVRDNGVTETLTAQEFYEFYIIQNHGLHAPFDHTKRRVDSGETVVAEDNQFDWGMGSVVYKGRLFFKKIASSPKVTAKPNTTGSNCLHRNKYINEAGGIKFWYCKDCKSDLGDA